MPTVPYAFDALCGLQFLQTIATQRLRFAWRCSALAIIGVWMVGSAGHSSWAADAFDQDYEDCPSSARLAALSGLRAVRTGGDDLKVYWNRADPASWNLGRAVYRSQIVIIAASAGNAKTAKFVLGHTQADFSGVRFAEELTVSAAVVAGKYVISDIAVVEFDSIANANIALGFPEPTFSSPFYLAQGDGSESIFKGSGGLLATRGKAAKAVPRSAFYYLGFNHNFANWYVNTGKTYPKSPKFRIGLRHGTGDPNVLEDADFSHFRVRVLDSAGDDVLGFDGATDWDSQAYENQVLVIGANDRPTHRPAEAGNALDERAAPERFSSITQSNRISNRATAYYQQNGGFWNQYFSSGVLNWITDRAPRMRRQAPDGGPAAVNYRLSYQNVMHIDKIGTKGTANPGQSDNRRQLFTLPPAEIYDLPVDTFADDGYYTIKAWAENDDGRSISSEASITLLVMEQFRGKAQSNLAEWRRDGSPADVDDASGDYYNRYLGGTAFYEADGYREAVVLDLSVYE